LLPIALTEHARVTQAVRRDEPVPLDAVEVDTGTVTARLRALQDDLLRDAR
jgi:predicted homoserine dehydrogenase-like protein